MKFAVYTTLLIAMMVLPLPHYIINALLILNLVLAFALCVVSVMGIRPIKHYPDILLVLHLFMLALNVQTTRVILSGHGLSIRLVEYMGDAIVGSKPVLGLTIFVMMSLIQYLVHGKACIRIAKITEGLDLTPESSVSSNLLVNFWREMRDYSKFAKNRNLYSILIPVINLLGGIVIATNMRGIELNTAFQNYALLTVGIGVVTLFQALFLETATVIVITSYQKQSGST